VLTASNAFNGVEVIDLSKNSLLIDGLQELTQSCVQLQPDQIVVFAGNNWVHKLYEEITEEDYEKIAEIYKKEGYRGVKIYTENKLEKIVQNYLKVLVKTSKIYKIPLVIIIPGFNLLDWKSDDVEKILTRLPGNQIQEWILAKNDADSALANDNQEEFNIAAERMVTLDPSNPTGFEYLAKSYIQQGKFDAARECLDESKDTILFGRGISPKPRCFRIIRDILIQTANQHNIPFVDVHNIFTETYPNAVAGKELYLDYCHLSEKGIKIAMKHTAKVVIEALTETTISLNEVPESNIHASDITASVAHFCAAIHNAHFKQPKEILRYHCKQAVALHPEIKEVMLQYLDFTSRKTSSILCGAFQEIIEGGLMEQYEGGMSLIHPNNKKLIDIELLDAVVEALKETGEDYSAKLQEMRVSEHGITEKSKDLLSSFYRLQGYNGYNTTTFRNYIQLRNQTKEFTIITTGNDDLEATLVYRIPAYLENKTFNIYLNSKENLLKSLPKKDTWEVATLHIPSTVLQEGVNTIIVECPIQYDSQNFLETANTKTVMDSFFPVLAEIQAFTIKTQS
jgi:lysophospholipase L1-like esterase